MKKTAFVYSGITDYLDGTMEKVTCKAYRRGFALIDGRLCERIIWKDTEDEAAFYVYNGKMRVFVSVSNTGRDIWELG